MWLTRHVLCHIFREINPSTLHNDMIFVLRNFLCNTHCFFRDHLAGHVGILWKGMWRYFCLRRWVPPNVSGHADSCTASSPNGMTLWWCCGDIASQRCGDVAMDNMPESNSNQPEAHSTIAIRLLHSGLASTATHPRCGAYPYHARGRDLPRKSQRITYSAMMWLPQREVKISKVFPKKKWKPAHLAARTCARSPEVRKRSLKVKRLDTQWALSLQCPANFVTDHSAAKLFDHFEIFSPQKKSKNCEELHMILSSLAPTPKSVAMWKKNKTQSA